MYPNINNTNGANSTNCNNSKNNNRNIRPFAKNTVRDRNGVLGANRKPNYALWINLIRKHAPSKRAFDDVSDMYECYAYTVLPHVYKWAKQFKAGIIYIYEDKDSSKQELLLVHEKEICYRNKIFPMRRGFPKGERESEDTSAFHTACREFYEETGINIFDPLLAARLFTVTITQMRPEVGIETVLILFIVLSNVKPNVNICTEELVDYEWCPMNGSISFHNMTPTTKRVLKTLSGINFNHSMHTLNLTTT